MSKRNIIELLDPAPTRKDSKHEYLLERATGKNRRQMIRASKCMSCDNTATLFRDAASIREYQNSGFCQYCQDMYFEDAY